MTAAVTGAGALARFAWRRDRVRLPLWIALLALLVGGTAASWDRLYPTPEERLRLLDIVAGNPALSALLGPLTNPLSTGALTAWRISSGLLMVLALVNATTVTRHVRAEEESGRAELLMASPFDRLAPLTAVLIVTGLVNLVFVILAGLIIVAVGIEWDGAALLAATIAAASWLFAGLSAVSNQVFRSERAANGAVGGLIVVLWLVSALGNIQQNWLVWASPFGWVQQTDPFGAARWWTIPLSLAIGLVLVLIAARLNQARDLAGGSFADRPGRASASRRLMGVHALAWRLERSIVAGWVLAFAGTALFIGASRDSLVEFASSSPTLAQLIARLGGAGLIIDSFVAAYLGLAGLAAGFLAVALVLRLDVEETTGHAEVALATATRRSTWASAYVVIAVVAAALVLTTMGVVLGATFGVQGGQGLSLVDSFTTAALSWLAPVLFVVGMTLALVGWLPRWAAVAWVLMTGFAVLTTLGAVFGLPDWAVDLSPFSHVARAPAQAMAIPPLVWLTGAAALLAAAGYVGLARRDVRSA